jgi:AcrR family transcriptional regulator
MIDPPSTARKGRPRSEESRRAVLDATLVLLSARGFAELSIDGVAAASGVAKTTIYRWWSNRQELAVEAFFEATRDELAFPDTGSAREDFRQQIHQLADLLRSPNGQALSALISAARHDEALRTAIGQRWVAPRRVWGMERLQAAVDAMECVDGLRVASALEVLYSPIYARMLFGMGVPAREEVEANLQIVFRGIFL